METIARAAGVSVPTVSRVVNGRGGVGEETRVRVERLLSRHGYETRTARAPAAAGTVDVIFEEIDCAWEMEHVRGMEAAADEAGVGLVVTAMPRDAAGRDRLVRRFRAGATDGAILVSRSAGPLLAALHPLHVPLIMLEPATRTVAELPAVGAANWSGAREATDHLLGLGHRRIGMITGRRELRCSRARLDGYRAAHDEAGVAVDPDLVQLGEFEYRSGLLAAQRLLDRADPPTAIFASNDAMAVGVYEAARRLGVAIPERLSVVGFDDLPNSRWLSPALTTVRQPLRDMGRLATRTVLRLARGESVEPVSMELGTRLVIRQSTAPVHRRVLTVS